MAPKVRRHFERVTLVIGLISFGCATAITPTPTAEPSLTEPAYSNSPTASGTVRQSFSPAPPPSPPRSTASPSGGLVAAAPVLGRWNATAVWTGEEAVITGGNRKEDGPILPTAAVYNPETNIWRRIANQPYTGGGGQWAFQVGGEIYYWSDFAGYEWPAAAIYQVARDSWRVLEARRGALKATFTSVWTGTAVVMWGRTDSGDDTYGAAYQPANDTWSDIAPAPLAARSNFSMVWTGTEVVIWGGGHDRDELAFADGAAYNPATNTWRMLPDAPIEPRVRHQSVWTGSEVVIWGGQIQRGESALWDPQDWFGDGAIYHPGTDSWTPVPPAPLFPWSPGTSVWTGRELLLLYGITCGNWNDYPGCDVGSVRDGAAYDPSFVNWRYTRPGPLDARWGEASAWMSDRLFVWGGYGVVEGEVVGLADGAVYDPAADHWLDYAPP